MTALRRAFLGVLTVLLLAVTAAAVGYAVRQGTGPDISGAPDVVATPSPVAQQQPAVAPASPAAQPASYAKPRVARQLETRSQQRPMHTMEPGRALLSPGDAGDDVRDLQARLRQIYWYAGDVTGDFGKDTVAAVRGFQAKRQIPVTGVVDQRTSDRLAAMTVTPGYREKHNLGNTPGALDARCETGRVICIDKTSRTLRWVVDGKVLKTMDVRFGAYYSPTRDGVFHVYLKDADHVSGLYDSAMPYSMFFSGGQAVHYSSDFAARGYEGASHGCVNVRDYDAVKWLYEHAEVGDTVVVYWS